MLLTKHKLEHSKKYFIVFIPALIWAGIIAFMSLLPSDKLPLDVLVVSDKLIHSSIYFGLTLLLILAFIYRNKLMDAGGVVANSFFISALISLMFGIIIEVAQEKMNIGRSGDWKDVAANLFGIVIVYPFVIMVKNTNIFKKLFIHK